MFELGRFIHKHHPRLSIIVILSSASATAAAVSAVHAEFRNTSTGQSPNTIYALAFCLGDTSASVCEKCVSSVAHDLVEWCPNQKAASSWGTGGEPCFVRYSNAPIYGVLETELTLLLPNLNNVTVSPAMWWNLTQGAVNGAVDDSSKLKFATGLVGLPGNRTIYSLLQCSPGLSADDYRICLGEALDYYDEFCPGRQASGVYTPSCVFRWDLESSHRPLWYSPPPPAGPPAPGGNIYKGALLEICFSQSWWTHIFSPKIRGPRCKSGPATSHISRAQVPAFKSPSSVEFCSFIFGGGARSKFERKFGKTQGHLE